mgnify:CR=1 FL=1
MRILGIVLISLNSLIALALIAALIIGLSIAGRLRQDELLIALSLASPLLIHGLDVVVGALTIRHHRSARANESNGILDRVATEPTTRRLPTSTRTLGIVAAILTSLLLLVGIVVIAIFVVKQQESMRKCDFNTFDYETLSVLIGLLLFEALNLLYQAFTIRIDKKSTETIATP